MQEIDRDVLNEVSVADTRGLASYEWRLSYRTSSTFIEGRPVDMLRDFYVPALSRAVRYDRVAGYFRSSSLAAASQGFSAFVGRQGKMRLIVGADLELEDVKAILAGDAARLAQCLNRQLDQTEKWPEGVTHGVTLLAWMVAQGYLEIKVAFRRHAVTGEALTFEDTQDGYVHEKWFVLHDQFGHRLYGSGTLNESKTALVLNAENIDVHCDWWGELEYRRTQQAADDFEILWEGNHPCLPVFTLPEAVRQRLLDLAEGTSHPVELDGRPADPWRVPLLPSARERLQFAVIKDAPHMPGGRLVGMYTAPVAPWPHQEVVARRLVTNWPYSFLLCDEVGLGKTIEAGLAIRSLYLSGLARRVLIAAPASLTRQWQREMASKMLLSFGCGRMSPVRLHEYIYPYETTLPSDNLYEPDLNIVSTKLISRQTHQDSISGAKPFDITLVDEAHAARRSNPAQGFNAHPDYGQLYTVLRDQIRPKTRSLWLATATPMQLHPVEVSDLLALTDRVGPFQYDPVLCQQYYWALGKLVSRLEVERHEWQFIRRAVMAIESQDPLYWQYLNDNVIDPRRRRAFEQWLNDNRIPRGRDRDMMLPLLFSAAPLSRVMMRHTRQFLEVYQDKGQLTERLAVRHIRPLDPIKFSPGERAVYDDLQAYLQGLSEQIRAHGNQASKQMLSFLLSFFRLRFASSLFAFRSTMERRLRKVEVTLLQQLRLAPQELLPDEDDFKEMVFESVDESDLEAVESYLSDRTPADLEWERDFIHRLLEGLDRLSGQIASKMHRLLKLLDERRDAETGRIKQTVIFTRFYDTLQDIVKELKKRDRRVLLGSYSGHGGSYYDSAMNAMVSITREEVKERFLTGRIDVLVCTDAAAEGLNLQTADLLINFDLPWNPMKVEQRIGRIDRIGQKHQDIYVENLCYIDSAEQKVYGRLLDRLRQASLVVGSQQLSLLPVDHEDFAKLSVNEITLEELEQQVTRKIEQQQQNARSMQIQPEHLYDIYQRLKQKEGTVSLPVRLEDIWDALTNSPYLQARGGEAPAPGDPPVYLLPGIENRPDNVGLTVSRVLYEEGAENLQAPLHFATYGDTIFDALLQHMDSFPLPGCVRRLTTSVPGMDEVEIHAYVAACRDSNGLVNLRLICSYRDLVDLELAEDYTLTDAEVEPLLEQLETSLRNEFTPLRVSFVEMGNVQAARAHEVVSYMAARDLLEVRAGSGGDHPAFWPIMREVNNMVAERKQLDIRNLPADILRTYRSSMLFEYTVSRRGDKADIKIPRIILESATAAAERLADGERVRRRDLTVTTMLRRLQAEADKRRREL